MTMTNLSATAWLTFRERARQLIHQTEGPLTRELIQTPARFGLGRLPASRQPTATTRTTCGFCSTGCGLTVHLDGNEAISLSPSPDYPVNLGMACPKGWEALEVLKSSDRATTPLLRAPDGTLRPVGWDVAIPQFVERLRAIQDRHGPEGAAFLGSGQLPTEELAFLGALCKFGLGMLHGDANTRQCMATSAVAYKQSFGFDAPPFTYADFEASDVLVFVGANPCIAHPILWERVIRNQLSPEIVVIDPRRTETAMQATRHLAIRPKGDLSLLYGVARILIENDWIDREYVEAHTSGFADFANHVAGYTPSRVTEDCGIDPVDVTSLAETIHRGKAVSFWWTMGVNQSHQGVRTAQAIIALSLMTGNIGRPGTGPNSITGQCNAMGSRLFSHTTGLPGGRDFTNGIHRREVASILDIPMERIPTENSLAYPEILKAIEQREIRALWIVGTNPAHSWIDQSALRRLRDNLDLLVVQDMYVSTETAQLADIVLPAAGWGEKEGTFINSERRISVIKKVARPPGLALPDLSIFRLIAAAAGCASLFERWRTAEEIFVILQELSAGRPCDFMGINGYRHLDEAGGIQWPFTAERQEIRTERRLFESGHFYTTDRRARFHFEDSRPLPEPPDDDYPLILMTGRGSVAQWHTGTRTGKSAVLRQLAPDDLIAEIHPDDARRFDISPGEPVEIRSRRGRVTATAFVTTTIQPGQVFLPMHDRRVNLLTYPAFDPHSRQPSYKDCAISISRGPGRGSARRR